LKLNDPRIQEQLLALPDPDHSDFGGVDDDSEESSLEDRLEEFGAEESSTEESSTEARTGDSIAEEFLHVEAAVVESAPDPTVVVAESGTDSTVVTFQLKVSVPRHRRSKKLPYHGFGSWNLKQHSLLFQQVDMTNLRHVHLSYDFENLTNSHGSIMCCMLADVGMQVWPRLKTLKICITYEVDSRFAHWSRRDQVSSGFVSSHQSLLV
jgi:hypothetical protein